ncbi:RFT1 Oligosaccharide translocation protein RFT1 [Candida maltosa Xu316]|uniref:Man(5)GlcNAc(2)-PP-dolichol translocation protein RFT1 n=1 Tax=Candida maltosa (strain Xu316) TaxID=1245528 RepID=M3K0B3_CANMX|nr:hypothetical protein G210_0656 [Candida maltosa Xu316]
MPDRGKPTNAVNQSAKGVTYLILVQIITKLFTFILNQLIIRYLTPSIIGITTYLDFIYSTILFFSRESIRLSIQRIQSKHQTSQKVINFGILGILLLSVILPIIGYWQFQYSSVIASLYSLPYHQLTILLVVLSIVVEMVIEPIYCLYQFQLDFGKRSKFEGLAVVTKCVVTFVSIMIVKSYFSGDIFSGSAICAFALGQFSYSLTLAICYYASFRQDFKSEENSVKYGLVKVSENDGVSFYFQPEILLMVRGFFVQMIFKQLLTEGDKLLISYLCTIDEQGVYAVVSNYGSMVARLLFQPLEESTRLMFTKLLNDKESKSKYKDSFNYLKLISIFYFNLSLLILFAGLTNGSYLLKLLMGGKASNWAKSNIFDIFPQYITYLPFLAFNGILEALFSSMANNNDLQKFSKFMTLITVIVLIVSYGLIDTLQLRISGLILANILNMVLRIGYCSVKIRQFYISHGMSFSITELIKYIFPSVIVATILWGVQFFIIGWKTTTFVQLVISAGISGILLLSLMVIERDNLKQPLLRLKKKIA